MRLVAVIHILAVAWLWLIWVTAWGRPIESTRHAVRHAADRS